MPECPGVVAAELSASPKSTELREVLAVLLDRDTVLDT